MNNLIKYLLLILMLIFSTVVISNAQDTSSGVVVKSGAFINSKAGIFGHVIKRLDKGDTVNIISTANKYYVKVSYKDTTIGYMNKEFIVHDLSILTHDNTLEDRDLPFVTKVDGGHIDSEPSSFGSTIESLNDGDTITVISIANNDYVKVKHGSITGYLYKSFLSGYEETFNITTTSNNHSYHYNPCQTISTTTTSGVYGTGKTITKKCGDTYVTKIYVNGELISTTKTSYNY